MVACRHTGTDFKRIVLPHPDTRFMHMYSHVLLQLLLCCVCVCVYVCVCVKRDGVRGEEVREWKERGRERGVGEEGRDGMLLYAYGMLIETVMCCTCLYTEKPAKSCTHEHPPKLSPQVMGHPSILLSLSLGPFMASPVVVILSCSCGHMYAHLLCELACWFVARYTILCYSPGSGFQSVCFAVLMVSGLEGGCSCVMMNVSLEDWTFDSLQ